jgi:MoaA/NifB/PqqE/SkfB family radical SAM enzyme
MRTIRVGFACDNTCVFCAQGSLRASRPGPEPVREALSVVRPGDDVAFVGGEPLLAPDLPDWIAEADRRGAARVLVQTNGRLLARPVVTRALAAASKRLSLEVSLHGSTALMHDYHTGVPGSFVQTGRGLFAARSAGLPVGVGTVVTRSNFRHLADLVRLSHSLGARSHLLALAEPSGRAAAERDRVVPAAALVAPHLRAALAEGARLGLEVVTEPTASKRVLFAGVGEREPEAVRGSAASAAVREEGPNGRARVSLRLAGRPAPGREEVRTRDKHTGEALRAILPTLFEPGVPADEE